MTIEPLSEEWVAGLVTSTVDRPETPGLDGVVTLTIGKTRSASFEIVSGRVTGPTTATADVAIPFTSKQLAAWADGDGSLTVAYMKGDLKPVGASGPLFAALDVLDDGHVRRWAAQISR